MNFATFILSTGRCGTQWLAAYLAAVSGETAVVEHEPLHERYYPRLMLASGSPEATGNAAEIIAHCERIETILENRHYVECGWPTWGALPYLLKRFEGRIRVVHLIRHPVPVACSWVSHRAYCPPLIPGYPGYREKTLASPRDEGTAFPRYAAYWEVMSPYEKSLFFWLEVNALGLRLEEISSAPWLRIRFEDLFDGDALHALNGFLDFPVCPDTGSSPDQVRDEFRHLCDFWWNPQDIQKHPEIMAVAARLGYDPLDFDERKLRERYFPVVY